MNPYKSVNNCCHPPKEVGVIFVLQDTFQCSSHEHPEVDGLRRRLCRVLTTKMSDPEEYEVPEVTL